MYVKKIMIPEQYFWKILQEIHELKTEIARTHRARKQETPSSLPSQR